MIGSVLIAFRNGGRAAAVRFALTAAGVSLASIFLLAALAYPETGSEPAGERALVLALLSLPMLLLVALSALVGMRMRAQRLAALRLLGATPAFVAALTALETCPAALAGALAGALSFRGAADLAGAFQPARLPFSAGDLEPPLVPGVLALSALVLLAGAVVLLALRDALLHPLAARARTRSARLGRTRLAVLALGLIGFLLAPALQPAAIAAVGVLVSLLAIVAGLLGCGPWLTQQGASRALLRASDRPSALLAGRFIGADRPGGFRAPAMIVIVVGLLVGTTILSSSLGAGSAPRAAGEPQLSGAEVFALALLGLVLVTGIAGTIISAVDGVGSRRRELGLLRATGVPNGTLRRALALEQAAPLVTAVAIGAIAGAALPIVGLWLVDRRGASVDLEIPWLAVVVVIASAAAVGVLAASAAALCSGGRIPPEALRPE